MNTVLVWLPFFLKWLIQTTIVVSILIGLILVLKWLLKDRLPVKWQYALWIIVIFRAVLPWAPQSSFSLYNLFPIKEQHSSINSLIVDRKTQALHDDIKLANEPLKSNKTEYINEPSGMEPRETLSKSASPVQRSVVPTTDDWIYAGLFGLWLMGVISLSILLFLTNRQFARNMISGSHSMASPAINHIFLACKNELGIKRKITLLITDQKIGPALHGLWSPIILLPASIVNEFSEKEIRYILLHELVHYKRKDIAVNWVLTSLLIVHWFNPVLWYAYRKMREDQELSCDAKAISYIGPEEVKNYGYTIIRLLETFSSKNSKLLATAYFSKNRLQIKRRITMITLFKKKSYKRTALGLFMVVIFISVALTNAKAEDANPTTILNEEVTSDKQDWLWFNDYERSSDLGLVYDPDIKVEDKGYSFEIESVLVDSSRLVISAKHNGPDGRFLQSPLEDTEIRVTDLKGNVVATEGISVGNTYPGVQEYVFLFDELPPDQVVVQAKPQYIWVDKEDQIKREKIEVNWDFEFTLDMIKTKQLDKRDLLNEKYITSAGFEMGIGQFIRTPNGMRIDMNLSLNDELGKMAVQNWGDYMNIWYHLETDDQKENNKYFGQKVGSYATKIKLQDVVEANGNVSWSNTWSTSTVSPELKNIRFVVDEYSLPINKEAAVEIDLSKLAKTPVVFEDEGDTITIEEHQFEKESSTGKTSLRFSGKGTYKNQAIRDEWIVLDENGKTYTVRTEGSGSSTADGGSVWGDLDFVITDVPDNISQLTLKRVIVDKKFTDVDWSVDLPSYSSLPWLSK